MGLHLRSSSRRSGQLLPPSACWMILRVQVCRSSTDSCNLCKCTSGGEVQCQNKNCDNHERPGTSGVNPTYQTCDATKCTFEYKGSSNKRSKYEFDAKSKSWKENKNHDGGKFLKVIHDGVEDKGSHHFCAYNL